MKTTIQSILLLCISLSVSAQLIPYRKGALWGFTDATGRMVKAPEYYAVSVYDGGIFSVQREDMLWGLMKADGTMLTDFAFSWISPEKDVYIAQNADGYHSLLDKQGKPLTESKYDYVFQAVNRHLVATTPGKIHLLDITGKTIREHDGLSGGYDYYMPSAPAPDRGYVVISENANYKSGVMDTTGKIIIKPAYDVISLPRKGLMVAVTSDMKYGVLNTRGKTVIPFDYDYIELGSNDLFAASRDGKYGALNGKGKTVIPFTYTFLTSFYNGAAVAGLPSGNHVMIDVNGKPLSAEYQYITCDNGHFVANNYAASYGENSALGQDQTYTVLDAKGKEIFSGNYTYFYAYTPTRFIVMHNNLYGMIDNTGKVIIPLQYPNIGSLNPDEYMMEESGMYYKKSDPTTISVYDGKYYALFDLNGKKLTDFKYISFNSEYAGLAMAQCKSGRYTYIDKNGKEYFEEIAQEVVTVSNMEEFLNAVGSDKLIYVKQGTYDLSEVSDDYSAEYAYKGESYTTGQNEFTIVNVSNMTIKAEASALPEFLQPNTMANVMNFSVCYNVTFEGIKAGHGVNSGTCSGGVLNFESCYETRVSKCDLYGSGVIGITASSVNNFVVENSVIRDCTSGITDIKYSTNVEFNGCMLKDNYGYNQVNLEISTGVVFRDCTFRNNDALEDPFRDFYLVGIMPDYMQSKVRFENCVFEDNEAAYFTGNAEEVELINCKETHNTYRKGRFIPTE